MIKNFINKIWKSATAYLVGSIAFVQVASVFLSNVSSEEMFGRSSESVMQIIFVCAGLVLCLCCVCAR